MSAEETRAQARLLSAQAETFKHEARLAQARYQALADEVAETNAYSESRTPSPSFVKLMAQAQRQLDREAAYQTLSKIAAEESSDIWAQLA